MRKRGGQPIGKPNIGSRLLTDEQVMMIPEMILEGLTRLEIVNRLGVSYGTVSGIIIGNVYLDLQDRFQARLREVRATLEATRAALEAERKLAKDAHELAKDAYVSSSRLLRNEEVMTIPELILEGLTRSEIGDRLGVCDGTIRNITGGRTYPDVQEKLQKRLREVEAILLEAKVALKTAPTMACVTCGNVYPRSKEFFRSTDNEDGFDRYCKPCMKKRRRRYREELRMEVLSHYSGGEPMCACCKITEVKFLCIDHIDGGGTRHRREIGTMDIYKWTVDNDYPSGLRVLCMNCNGSYGAYGYCPHQKCQASEKPDIQGALA